MKTFMTTKLNLGAPLLLTFTLLVVFILGGNALLAWQFRIVRQQNDRLAVASKQTMAVLRLQYALVSFHQSLNELVDQRDAHALARRSSQLPKSLLEELQRTREALALSPGTQQMQTRFMPVLDALEVGFPHQVDIIASLAETGDWGAVNRRLADQLKPREVDVTALAEDMDAAYTAELSLAERNTLRLQDRILLLIPLMALSTFAMAALFVWIIARRIIELRIEERLTERMRITRDLHDTFLQTIQGSKLFTQHTLAKCSDLAGMRQALGQLAEWLDRATEEGRSALNALQATQDARHDLSEMLRTITEDARAQGPMKVVLSISGNPISLIPEVQDEVGRIAREALTNARKHSQGSQAELRVEYSRDFSLTISDDGKGFESIEGAGAPNGHYGLRGMRERAAHLGGKLTISSSPASGTQVKLVLPGRLLRRVSGVPFENSDSTFLD